MKTIYMDHSATTPVDPRVFSAMIPYYNDVFGNASSVHTPGQKARQAVEDARDKVAALIKATPQEIIFTTGGTEADNQALIGYMQANAHRGRHIITSAIEHHAVLDTCEYLHKQGYDLTVLPVNSLGMVEPQVLKDTMRDDTVLVSIMHANNEIGTIQSIKELAAIAHEGGAVFHTDAVQSFGKLDINVRDMGIDMLSASAHKLYGPKGIGCLYVNKKIKLAKYLHGGAQERNRRAGTENVPAIVGFGVAAQLAGDNRLESAARLTALGQRLQKGILERVPHARLTGHPSLRLPGSVSVCFEFVEGESVLLMLDSYGIAASSGSACTSGSLDPSHVLLAIGLPHVIAHGSLRLTLGHSNTDEDVDYVLDIIPKVVESLRKMSPLYANVGGVA